MQLLLDTHAFLWWLDDDPRLSEAARDAISDANALVYVSAASIWEAEIKIALGRLEFDDDVDLAAQIAAESFAELSIAARHARAAATLPRHHGDPFDRMLIAQAVDERLRLVTGDEMVRRYDVDVLVT